MNREGDVKNLSARPWQFEAFNTVKESRFAVVSAFCGSGKTVLSIGLAIDDIKMSGYLQKQLIVVPQSMIAENFTRDGKYNYIHVDLCGKKHKKEHKCGKIHTWSVQHNFCDASNSNIIAKLKEWLLRDSSKLKDKFENKSRIGTGLAAVATHQALGLVWNNSSSAEHRRMIHNLTLRIDEAHHVKGVFDLTEGDLAGTNKKRMEGEATNLGHIGRAIVNSKDTTAKLHLVTATFYRGDQEAILSPTVQNQFKTYYADWLDHWKGLGIKRFNIEFEFYKKDPVKPTVKRHKPSEWVRIAEKLAKVNGGVLPGSLWLNTHGYSGLASLSGRDHPELFKHISRSSKRLRNYPWKDLS